MMRPLKRFWPLVFISVHLFFLSSDVLAKLSEAERDRLIGNIVKNALETYHYRDLKIDDSLSKKAFNEYIKRLDFGKQFFLKSDIELLQKYQMQMDDEMVSGRHELIEKSNQILKQRLKEVDDYRKEVFKKNFDFKENETLEIDPEKRDFAKSDTELKDLWRKTYKQAVLTRYLSLQEEQREGLEAQKNGGKNSKGEEIKKKKKGKQVPFKKMTEQEVEKKAMDAIAEKYERLFARLLKEDHDDHLEKFINSIAAIFDPHTNYLPPKKKEDFDIDISGSLEGIGAVLQEDGPYIKVVQIVPGGAAWRQKELEVDDMILMVAQGSKDPVDLMNMRVDDAVRYIRGKKGTEVRLTVKKVDGSRKIIPIVRDVVQIGASFAKSSVLQIKGTESRVGYINVPKFYRDFNGAVERNCTDDVKTELERLKKLKVDAVILDLRNNGGGALEDARLMSGLFVDKGPMVQVRDHNGEVEVLSDNDPTISYDGPLIVMVNRFSASASEIVAGAMQDYGRAIIVGGENTHGKGTVQAVLNLNQGPLLTMFGPTMGALKVTIQKFYRVSGASTQYKGITSDITLPDPMSYSKSREQDLDYSLEWDQISGKQYNPWKKFSYNLSTLKDRSQKRVAKNEGFKKINESVSYLKKRQDETIVSLNIEQVTKEEKELKEMSEKLKLDQVNKDVEVTGFEDSLKASMNFSNSEDKKWKEDFKQMKEEWVKGLQQDVALAETVLIADDVVKMIKEKPLAQVSK